MEGCLAQLGVCVPFSVTADRSSIRLEDHEVLHLHAVFSNCDVQSRFLSPIGVEFSTYVMLATVEAFNQTWGIGPVVNTTIPYLADAFQHSVPFSSTTTLPPSQPTPAMGQVAEDFAWNGHFDRRGCTDDGKCTVDPVEPLPGNYTIHVVAGSTIGSPDGKNLNRNVTVNLV
jgi:hypothetical protein